MADGLGQGKAGEATAPWGGEPTAGYVALAARFRPIFARSAEGVVERENGCILPFEQIGWLKVADFGAVRVPCAEGGDGAMLPELFVQPASLA